MRLKTDEELTVTENGAFCLNSRVWLALRGFTAPTTCPNRNHYEQSACRGCGYFELREPTRYVRKQLELLGEVYR